MAIATVATVPIDLVFIPWCDANLGNGGIGGSISFIITEGGMLAAGLMLLPKGMLARENLWLSLRALLAGLLMTAAIYPLRDYFLAIPILVAVLVYGVLVFVLKLVPDEDFQLVREMAGNILSRVKRRSSSGN